MAIPGIIENHAGWEAVTDPDFQPPQASWFAIFKKHRPQHVAPPAIYATDFINAEIRDSADRFVKAMKTILGSNTVSTGGLGESSSIHQSLHRQLYKRLLFMRTVDESLVDIAQEQKEATANATPILNEMAEVIADSLESGVIKPTSEIEALAEQVKLRDMTNRLPQVAAKLSGGQTEPLDALTARLQALCDLDMPTIR